MNASVSKDENIPPPVTEAERWIVLNRVEAVRSYYKMTSEDTSDNYLELTASDGKKVNWLEATFNQVASLRVGGSRGLVEPKYGLKDKVLARDKYEKSNAAELATFKRLKAKYEGNSHDHPS